MGIPASLPIFIRILLFYSFIGYCSLCDLNTNITNNSSVLYGQGNNYTTNITDLISNTTALGSVPIAALNSLGYGILIVFLIILFIYLKNPKHRNEILKVLTFLLNQFQNNSPAAVTVNVQLRDMNDTENEDDKLPSENLNSG